MFRPAESVEDFKSLTHDLRRQNADLKSENRLLKVKVRKLQDEISKKEKEFQQNLLDPNKTRNVRKLLAENGASIVMHLKKQNDELERNIIDKDLQIKRLQNSINNIKLYQTNCYEKMRKGQFADNKSSERCSTKNSCEDQDDFQMLGDNKNIANKSELESKRETAEGAYDGDSEQNEKILENGDMLDIDDAVLNWTHDILTQNLEQIKSQYVNNDMRAKYESLTRDHLVSIIENLKLNVRNVTNYCAKLSSRIHKIEKDKVKKQQEKERKEQNECKENATNLPDTTLFIEVEQMKEMILLLQEDKRSKDENIKQLAEEIDHLKKSNSTKCVISGEEVKSLKSASLPADKSDEKMSTNSSKNDHNYIVETLNKLEKNMYHLPNEDYFRFTSKPFASIKSRKQNHKEQISTALKLLKNRKKHPEKYEKQMNALKAVKDDVADDDADVFTAP